MSNIGATCDGAPEHSVHFSYCSSLQDHDFNAICTVCAGVCGVTSPVSAPSATFIIPTSAGPGGEITVTFAQPLPVANAANANALVLVPAAALASVVITGINGAAGPFAEGAYATDAAGNLKALLLLSNGRCVFFSSCGPFVVQDGNINNRKRTLFTAQTTGLGGGSATSAIGDPHIRGLFGINIEFFGKGDRAYSLVTAPSFEVNMRLSNAGPDERFMTSLSVLYRNTSYVITPWGLASKKTEIINHFESLGSTVAFAGAWIMTIELCPHHKLKFTAHHTTDEFALNYLNFEFDVPGCHDSYGGVLGQTYKCKWANEKFVWSREMEESFRVPTIKTASRTYSPTAMIDCAAENDFGPRL